MKGLHGAFPPTPGRVEDAIYEGIRRARRHALLRRRLQRFAAAAAVLAVLVGAFALLRSRVRPDNVFGQGGRQALAGPSATEDAAPSPRPTPAPSPTPLRTDAPDGAGTGAKEVEGPLATTEAPTTTVTPEPSWQSGAPYPATTPPQATQMPLGTELPAGQAMGEGLSGRLALPIDIPGDTALLEEAEVYYSADPLEVGTYWSTDTGTWFHADPNCTGMSNAQLRPMREALSMGQDFCPVCIHFAEDGLGLAWSRETDEYYHASAECAGVEDPIAGAEAALTFVERARLQGKLPCPDCVTYTQLTPAVLSGPLYCTAGGIWVHSEPDCNGMLNARHCTLGEALSMGKTLCPDCIGEDCVYVNGVYWNPTSAQLLVSLDTYTAVGLTDVTLGNYIGTSALEASGEALNTWDAVVLGAALETEYGDVVADGGALRIDTRALDVSLNAGDCVASIEWTEADGCRHVRMLWDGVTEEELGKMAFSVTATGRYYWLDANGLLVRNAPAVEARLMPRGAALNYVFDDADNCVRFKPGNLLEPYDWTQDNAVDMSYGIDGLDGEAHISIYWFDAISNGGEGMAILEVRVPADVDIHPGLGDMYRLSTGMHAEGREKVYTALLFRQQAEEVLEDPSLLGFVPSATAY